MLKKSPQPKILRPVIVWRQKAKSPHFGAPTVVDVLQRLAYSRPKTEKEYEEIIPSYGSDIVQFHRKLPPIRALSIWIGQAAFDRRLRAPNWNQNEW